MANSKADDELVKFIQKLPKVELHAHLNGCIRETTLFDLAKKKGVTLSSHHFRPSSVPREMQHDSIHSQVLQQQHDGMYNVLPRSLEDCFAMFAEIPACVNDEESLRRIAWEALYDFASDSVVYLELRSTPKALHDNFTKHDYIRTLLSVMDEFEETMKQQGAYSHEDSPLCHSRAVMTCRLIVAIDRGQSVSAAEETVDLAIAFSQQKPKGSSRVVGVDLGGNPTRQDFRDFQACFERARNAGLKITIHCGEVPCDTTQRLEEARAVLDFAPDRLGHALLLPGSLGLQDQKIPVETCPTSNVMTLKLGLGEHLSAGLRQHPMLAHWLHTQYPLAVGTDDPGVFHTSPTQELVLLARSFDLGTAELSRIVLQSMKYAFCDKDTQDSITQSILARLKELTKIHDESSSFK